MNALDVIKIWWENAGCDLETTVSYVNNNKRDRFQVLVVSAMRDDHFNTTDKLKDVAVLLNNWELLKAEKVFQDIFDFHKNALEKQKWWEIINEIREIFATIHESLRVNLAKNLSEENDFCIDVDGRCISLLWFWENISALVHSRMLEKSGLESQVIDTNHIDIQWNEDYIRAVKRHFSSQIFKILESGKIPVVGGFLWNLPWGILQNIDRGYTDATASLLALSQNGKYKEIRLNILKSIDGILWADPRLFTEWTKINMISEMDYLTARELIWGSIWWKAKFLHEYALCEEIIDAGIELQIMNPKKTEWGTLISSRKNTESHWVEVVNKRDNISFVTITKAMFAGWVWDLQSIFKIVEQAWFSIDIVITSETVLSFSLEVKKLSTLDKLKEVIVKEFFNDGVSKFNNVEIQNNMSLIHCIWQNLHNHTDYQTHYAKGLLALAEADIVTHKIWWEKEQWAIIFAVDTKNADESVRILARLFQLVDEPQ